jgi:hypothetical protein
MPPYSFDDWDLLREWFATRGEEGTDLAKPRGQRGPASMWPPRLTPILTLLQEVLADLFAVRDHVLQAQRHGGKPARAVLRQYERDRQWLTAPEEQAPFSFVWVCQALGLEASAVRRRYLSGQPVTLSRHHRVGGTSDKLSLESVPRKAGKARARRRHTVPPTGRGTKGTGPNLHRSDWNDA